VSFVLAFSALGYQAEAKDKQLVGKPVYNEETKSYFVLKGFRPGQHAVWEKADELARSRLFRGVPGRLAVVKSRSVEDFLINTFHPRNFAFIGLRYFCRYKKLLWVTGEVHPRTAYKNWHAKWYRTGIFCENAGYMPVYLTPNLKGPRWQAAGPAKYADYYFVEYPTGKP
jgi:hypothetical protein